MADVTLSDGREIEFDLKAITISEWREIFDPKTTVDDEDGIMARVSGLSVEELRDLSLEDWKRIWHALRRKVREPLADPN